MRRLLAAVWFCLWCCAAGAQSLAPAPLGPPASLAPLGPATALPLGPGFAPRSGAVAYVGPGDITSGALMFVNTGRAYTNAYAAALSAIVDVVDTATGLTTCTFHLLATGFVNTTECNATACAVACSITKLYDQTGNGNHVVQATLANMPALTFNAQNGLPCAAGAVNTSLKLQTAGSVTQAQPFSFTAVGESSGASATINIFIAQTSGIGITPNTNVATAALGGTSVNLTTTNAAFHAYLAVASATAPLFAIDSSANTSTSTQGAGTLGNPVAVMNRSTGSRELTAGFFCEAGIWPADLNSSYQAMLANMRSAWNF